MESNSTPPDPENNPENRPTAPFSTLPTLQRLSLAAPFNWLKLGWKDFCRAPLVGLFFGGCFAAMGWALFSIFPGSYAILLTLSAGFLLLGPFVCMGLYYVSRQLQNNEPIVFGDALTAWSAHFGPLAAFAIILLAIEMLWARASLIVFALSTDIPQPDFEGENSWATLLDPKYFDFFLGWFGLGSLFSTLLFSVCVVSIPMILDRNSDAISAGLTSIRLVVDQPLVMLLWALVIAILAFTAMLPAFFGLLVVAPVLGHASWHAYKAAVTQKQID